MKRLPSRMRRLTVGLVIAWFVGGCLSIAQLGTPPPSREASALEVCAYADQRRAELAWARYRHETECRSDPNQQRHARRIIAGESLTYLVRAVLYGLAVFLIPLLVWCAAMLWGRTGRAD